MKAPREIIAASLWAGLLVALGGCAAWQPPQTAYRPPLGAASTPNSAAVVPATAPAAAQPGATAPAPIVRGQDGGYGGLANDAPGSSQFRRLGLPVRQVQYQAPQAPAGNYNGLNIPPPPQGGAAVAPQGALPGPTLPPGAAPTLPQWSDPQPLTSPETIPALPGVPYQDIDPAMSTPVDVYVQETQTGRFMFGAGINSDAGVTGQIVVDERNFDILSFPTSFRDFVEGTAFRGGGQGFRLEAMPGSQVQRYLVSFTEPYLFNTPISLNLSGFLFDRRYFDWDEQRLGGRVALGYRLRPDLSLSGALRLENVEISDPREAAPDLMAVLGDNSLSTFRTTLTHDTRDIPFMPTEGHLIELSYEQAFGEFSYPRAELDYRKYFLVRQRPDTSGRHTLGFNFQLGFTGSDTPVFENFFAGGYSTLRGFSFRGASPVQGTTRVGGEFSFLGSTEYTFPLTADDMLKGALFVDFGTVEEKIEFDADTFRVAPGFGLRINVPALGPAPLAFDFAFPVAKADTDEERVFNFFFGVGR